MKMAQKNNGNVIVNMVMTIIIIVIISSVVAPRLLNNHLFQSHTFADQVQASLHNAQKIAIAQHQFVCVAFTASSMTLTTGPTSACGTPLTSQAGDASHVVNAPSGVTFSTPPANLYFDTSGKPSINQMIAIAGITTPIAVKTGQLVHSP
jgi:type II secretory pathway pseudopilin PulG